jgi:hypothetical protein
MRSTIHQLHIEADKVIRLQTALGEAATELQNWLAWARANDRVTKSEATRQERRIAKYRTLSTAVLNSEWKRALKSITSTRGRP